MSLIKKTFKYLAFAFIGFLLFSFLWVVLYKFINPPVTTMMLYNYFQQDEYEIKQEWRDLEDINKSVPLAFIAAEDQLFIWHSGFDIDAIKKAYEYNQKGKNTLGASTISQQVAKNVFLLPNRSFIRKGLEAYFTVLIEAVWGKRRIIEVYVNIVELGEGIYGVEAAAHEFFEINADELHLSESALMAAVLPNPILYQIGAPSTKVFRKKNWIIKQMKNLGGEQLVQHWYD